MKPFLLFISLRSPFARRIRLALHRLEIPHEVEVVDVFKHNEPLLNANPLGLVPTLLTSDVGPVTDSSAILEYLQDKTGSIWPKDFIERARIRQASTWCEGIMQSSVSYFIETQLHASPEPAWAKDYYETTASTLKILNQAPCNTWECAGKLTQAAWDLGVALEYLHLRIPGLSSEKSFPALYSVLKKCQEHKAFQETTPPSM